MKNELRIGNWVTIHRTEIEMLEGDFAYSDDFYKPIPLTEHWLFRFGFKYSSYLNNYKIEAGNYLNSIKLYEGEWCYNNDGSDAGCYFVTTIKYVHELQNLYFSINKEELILKK